MITPRCRSLWLVQFIFGVSAFLFSPSLRSAPSPTPTPAEAIDEKLFNGTGVFKSIDGGKTWENVGLKDSRQIGALIVDPRNENVVLVAALGHAFGPNAERGIFRTADGGKTWTKVVSKDENTGGIDVVF